MNFQQEVSSVFIEKREKESEIKICSGNSGAS